MPVTFDRGNRSTRVFFNFSNSKIVLLKVKLFIMGLFLFICIFTAMKVNWRIKKN